MPPRCTWPFVCRPWIVAPALAIVVLLVRPKITISGSVPGMACPNRIQSTGVILALTSAILSVVVPVAGFGNKLRRMYKNEGGVQC
jgi:hypothetical protein